LALLEVKDLHVFYGSIEALKGISIQAEAGQIVAILGANGAGKTTTLRAISGLLRPRSGSIVCDGHNLVGMSAHSIVGLGLSHVPEGRRIFNVLTVEENLNLGGYLIRSKPGKVKERKAAVYALFPRLAERRMQLAGTLSGGEQQMLAIGRAMMANPRLLLMDEPSEGLAPQIVAEVMATIRKLKESGLSIVLVEQNPTLVFDVADDVVILNSGRVAVVEKTEALKAGRVDLRQHLGVF
jgi:branched-chain amino acid transport system ATP-binding protein